MPDRPSIDGLGDDFVTQATLKAKGKRATARYARIRLSPEEHILAMSIAQVFSTSLNHVFRKAIRQFITKVRTDDPEAWESVLRVARLRDQIDNL